MRKLPDNNTTLQLQNLVNNIDPAQVQDAPQPVEQETQPNQEEQPQEQYIAPLVDEMGDDDLDFLMYQNGV